jgi:hypothetical protein
MRVATWIIFPCKCDARRKVLLLPAQMTLQIAIKRGLFIFAAVMATSAGNSVCNNYISTLLFAVAHAVSCHFPVPCASFLVLLYNAVLWEKIESAKKF